MTQRTRDVCLVGGGLAAAVGERERGGNGVQAAEIVADHCAEDGQRPGGAGFVTAEAGEFARLEAAGLIPGGDGFQGSGEFAAWAGGVPVRPGGQVEGQPWRQLVEQDADPCHAGQLAAQDADLLADVEEGGCGVGGEVLRRDQDDVGGDRSEGQRLGGEQVLQRQDVGGCLHGRGGHALLVGLPVDHRERLDLDDVEFAADLECDHVRFQVGQVAADLQPQHAGGHTRCLPGQGDGRRAAAARVSAGTGRRGWCCRRLAQGRRRRPRGV